MRHRELIIYGPTGHAYPKNDEVEPLLYDATHLAAQYKYMSVYKTPVQMNEDCSDVPPMLPIISKF